MTKTVNKQKRAADKPKKNASERINDLENQIKVLSIYTSNAEKNAIALAEEIDKNKEIIVNLNNLLSAILEASDQGSLNKKAVQAVLVQRKVEELEASVNSFVEKGALEKLNDDIVIDIESFLVVREVKEDGTVVNPRAQFKLDTMDDNAKDKMIGKKVGDLISLKDEDPMVEIMEHYKAINKEK